MLIHQTVQGRLSLPLDMGLESRLKKKKCPNYHSPRSTQTDVPGASVLCGQEGALSQEPLTPSTKERLDRQLTLWVTKWKALCCMLAGPVACQLNADGYMSP